MVRRWQRGFVCVVLGIDREDLVDTLEAFGYNVGNAVVEGRRR